MNVDLYNCKNRPNKINKSLGDKTVIENVRFKEDGALSITEPTILVYFENVDVEDLKKYNYARIPTLERYYFITDISTEGGLVRIDLKCDVLYTFRKDILGSYQYIARCQSEDICNKKLVDNMIPINSNTDYYVKKFPVAVDKRDCNYVILETVGKGVQPNG